MVVAQLTVGSLQIPEAGLRIQSSAIFIEQLFTFYRKDENGSIEASNGPPLPSKHEKKVVSVRSRSYRQPPHVISVQ